MRTAFALLCERCGLSHREAAAILNVRLDTVRSWSSGRNPTPDGVIAELRSLYARIDRAGREGAAQIEAMCEATDGDPDTVELGLSSDDHEAQSVGWPCVGAQAAALGLIAALTDVPVVIVLRGSTVASAAASDIHDKRRPR